MKMNKFFLVPVAGTLGVVLAATLAVNVHNYMYSDRQDSTETSTTPIETTVQGSSSTEEEPTSVASTSEENTESNSVKPVSTETSMPSTETENPTTQKPTQKPTESSMHATETSKQEATTPKPTETETESATQENVTLEKETHVEDHSPSFSFTVYRVNENSKTDLQKYFTEHGYYFVKSKAELIQTSQNFLNERTGTQDILYIMTRKGKFDTLAEKMDTLLTRSVEEKSPQNTVAADRYYYDYCGLDYQQYYANGVGLYRIRKVQDLANQSGEYSVYAVYYYSYTNAEENALIEEKIQTIVSQISGSDYDKVTAAHNYLCDNVTYEAECAHPHSAYGALIDGQCVCEGYAKAMKLLMDALEIPCDVVINDSHAWNEVCIDGNWYMIDVTNDDAHGGPDYPYFLLGLDRLMDAEDANMAFFNYVDGTNSSTRILADGEFVSSEE